MQKVFTRQVGVIGEVAQLNGIGGHAVSTHFTTADAAARLPALRQLGMHHLAQVADGDAGLDVMGRNVTEQAVDARVRRDGRA